MPKKWTDKPSTYKKRDNGDETPRGKDILIGFEPNTNFKPVTKGNKPRNTPGMSYRQALWNKEVRPNLDEIYRIAVRSALAGDPEMVKLFVNKSLPKNPLDKPLVITADANQQIANIFSYCAEGNITPEEAVKLSTIVKDRVSINEIKNFAEKLASIEAWVKDRDQGVTINAISDSVNELVETISHDNKHNEATAKSEELDCESYEE